MSFLGASRTLSWILAGAVLPLASARGASTAHSAMFPEEVKRAHWDRSCLDWPATIPEIGTGVAERNPGIYLQKGGGFYRAFVTMSFRPEKGETFEHLYTSVKNLVLDGTSYPLWVMPGINERPDGASYFVQVKGMRARARKGNRQFYLTGPYFFKVLWYERYGMSTVELRSDEVKAPPCDFFRGVSNERSTAADVLFDRAVFRMAPSPEIIRMLIAELYFIPRKKEGRLELRMRLVAEPSTLVYQLMPEAMMRSDIELRGRRIFQNLVDLRKTWSAAQGATSSSSNPWKSVVPVKRER